MFETPILFRKEKQQQEQPVMESVLSDKESHTIDRTEFKNIWLNDVIVKHGIELNVNLLNYGLTITSDSEKVATDLAVIDYNSNITNFINKMTRDTMIFGSSFTEYLYNKDKTKIVGLWNMDPTRVDFERDSQNNVVVDATGKPKSYVEKIPFMKDTPGATTDPMGNKVKKYYSDKVTHFCFEELPGTIEGISMLHSVYKIVKEKWEAEEAIKEAIKRFGVPIMLVTVGDDRHAVTKESMKEIANKLQGITKKSLIITPHWQKVDLLHPKQITELTKNLEYYISQIPVALSIPRALILETGESTNRATLRQQIRIYISKLEKMRESLRRYLIRDLFKTIAEVNGWDRPPEIKFNKITLEDVESFAKRAAAYVKNEILSPDEIKEVVKRMEEL